MSLIGIIAKKKDIKEIKNNLDIVYEVIEINNKSIENLKNIKFEQIIINKDLVLNKQEEEHTQEFETLCVAFSYLSDRIDSLSRNVNQMLNKQEAIKELSWWDLNKDKIYVGAFLIIIGLILWNRIKK